MTRNFRIMITFAVALGAAVLSKDVAAQERPFTIGISGGPSFPLGAEFSEEAGTGYHVQGSVGFAPATLPVGLRADVLWQVFPDEHEGNFREIGGMVNALAGIPLGIGRPYALGGIGLVGHRPPDDDHGDHVHAGEGETTFAWAAGGGFEFPFLGLTGAIEARYLAAGAGHNAIPISFGIRF
jgi:opacity protein-like surface antigen